MNSKENNCFSGPVTIFHGLNLPERAQPAGYAAIVDAFDLQVPLPRILSAVGERHTMVEMKGWRIFTPRYRPASSLEGHLTFALKYEGIDLGVLHRLFERIDQKEIVSIVRNSPTGAYARRLWFLYEWLTGKKIPLEDVKQGSYVKVLDPSLQLAIDGDRVRRQRVINNLPGTPQFCPLVFRTQKLEDFFSKGLKQRANEVIGRVPRDVVSRTAAFLLLKDSRSSYAIEGEEPPRNRIERWGRAIGEAGANPIDRDELVRLQEIVIGDTRFVHPGLREYGGFVGEHDRDSGMPIPEHISARAEDLNSLLTGLSGFNDRAMDKLDPVVAAACIAFGFVYIHPFEDGNGRIHRYLIHHVLAQSGFNPPEVVFPVSAVILKRINEYRDVLQQYSHRMLPFIEWQVSEDRNVRVTNETDFLYRFFDATPHTEFLFSCVEQTVEKDLPEETRFLQQYDEFRRGVESVVDMPDKTVNLLFRLIRQNKGRLSKRAREKEFAALDDAEAEQIEQLYSKWFSSNSNHWTVKYS